jgi:hypothetical protein
MMKTSNRIRQLNPAYIECLLDVMALVEYPADAGPETPGRSRPALELDDSRVRSTT